MPRPVTSAIFTDQLSRGRACHRCRKRKMKCDGEWPCAPCRHAQTNARSPEPPCCSYDNSTPPPPSRQSSRSPRQSSTTLPGRSSTVQMQLRIAELESQVKYEQECLDRQAGPSWARKLPIESQLRHLVNQFFATTLHAAQIIHQPSILAGLSCRPGDPQFPHPCILHSISAAASVYEHSSAASQDGLEHAEQARAYRDNILCQQNPAGNDMFTCLQSFIIISSFYYSIGHIRESHRMISEALQLAFGLGLHRYISQDRVVPYPAFPSSPFATPDSFPVANPQDLPPADSLVEAETRRSAFWVAYCLERWHAISNFQTSPLCDREITQLLPLPWRMYGDEEFAVMDRGIDTPAARTRQCHMFSDAPPLDFLSTDPQRGSPIPYDVFTLHVQASIIMSKAHTLCLRRYNGKGNQAKERAMEETIGKFSKAVSALTVSAGAGQVDPGLYVAGLLPHVAMVILYQDADTSLSPSQSHPVTCLLYALNSVHDLLPIALGRTGSGYQFSAIDHLTASCWSMCFRHLLRFIQSALDAGQAAQATSHKLKTESLRSALVTLRSSIVIPYTLPAFIENDIELTIGKGRYDALGHVNVNHSSPHARPHVAPSFSPQRLSA